MGTTRTTATKKKAATKKTTPKTTKKSTTKKTTAKKPATKKAEKAKEPKKTIRKTVSSPRIALDNNKEIILDIGLDLCGIKLSNQRYIFLLHYLTPGQGCFRNAHKAALRAGYSKSTASVDIYSVLREPDIQKIVKANEDLAYLSLNAAAKVAIEIKKQRAFYDPIDYFEEKEIVVEGREGPYTKSVMALKDMENMTPEQRMCIDGLDMKGQASIPVYIMPDREKNLNDIIKLNAEMEKSMADTGEEETREIIIERITVRETKRAQRPAELYDDIVEDPIEVEDDTGDDDDV